MENIVLGTLLGDACLDIDGTTPRLRIGHGYKQLDYLRWKIKLLGCNKEPIPYITGYGSVAYTVSYYNISLLRKLYDITHVNNTKTVTKEWLNLCDDFSIALWYQDDGSWNKSGLKTKNGDRTNRHAYLFTCGFDDNSVNLLRNWLVSRGYDCRIKPHKQKYKMIQFDHSSTIKLWNAVAPYLFIKSKVDMGIRASIRKCKYCSNFVVCSNEICDLCLYQIALQGVSIGEKHYSTISKRFGTISRTKLLDMKPLYKIPNIYWFNHDLLK